MALLQKVKDNKSKLKGLVGKFKGKKQPFLSGIQVESMEGGMVMLTDLWKDEIVILKVLRRFGCPICRYESRILSDLKPEFDKLKVKLIGIGFEHVGLQEFVDGKYWEWELYIDTDKAVHRATNLIKMPVVQGLSDLMSTATRAVMTKINKLGIPLDFVGDGFQLGGTFIVGPGDSGLIYEYRQTGAAIFPSVKQIFAAVGGDPNLVEDVAPPQCLFYSESIRSKRTPESQFSESIHTKYRSGSIYLENTNETENEDKNTIYSRKSKDKSIYQPQSQLAKVIILDSPDSKSVLTKCTNTAIKKKQILFTKPTQSDTKTELPSIQPKQSTDIHSVVATPSILSLESLGSTSLHVTHMFDSLSVYSQDTKSYFSVHNDLNLAQLEEFDTESDTESFYSTNSQL